MRLISNDPAKQFFPFRLLRGKKAASSGGCRKIELEVIIEVDSLIALYNCKHLFPSLLRAVCFFFFFP